jgi:hypothetical protein
MGSKNSVTTVKISLLIFSVRIEEAPFQGNIISYILSAGVTVN